MFFLFFPPPAAMPHISRLDSYSFSYTHMYEQNSMPTDGLPTPLLLSHLFGDIVLDQAVEGHHAADFQQDRDGGRLLSAPAVTGAASPRHSSHHGLVMAQVAASWTTAFLLAADLYAVHHVVSQQLALLQRRQVADEGDRLQLSSPTSASPLVCCLWRDRQEWRGGYV